eukprot:jgi/Bigna1/82688/fgenesh1_pg.95_\
MKGELLVMLLLILLLILLLLLRLRSKYKLLLATTHQSKHSSNYSKIHLALPRRCIYLMVPQQPSHSDEFTLALTRQLLLLSESLATERARNNMLERRIRQLRPESKRNLGGLLDDGHQEMDYSRSDIIKQQKFEYDSRIGPPKTMAAAVENVQKIRKEENDLEKERQQLILRNRETLKRILGSEALEMMSPSEQLHQQMGWDTNPSEQRRRQQEIAAATLFRKKRRVLFSTLSSAYRERKDCAREIEKLMEEEDDHHEDNGGGGGGGGDIRYNDKNNNNNNNKGDGDDGIICGGIEKNKETTTTATSSKLNNHTTIPVIIAAAAAATTTTGTGTATKKSPSGGYDAEKKEDQERKEGEGKINMKIDHDQHSNGWEKVNMEKINDSGNSNGREIMEVEEDKVTEKINDSGNSKGGEIMEVKEDKVTEKKKKQQHRQRHEEEEENVKKNKLVDVIAIAAPVVPPPLLAPTAESAAPVLTGGGGGGEGVHIASTTAAAAVLSAVSSSPPPGGGGEGDHIKIKNNKSNPEQQQQQEEEDKEQDKEEEEEREKEVIIPQATLLLQKLAEARDQVNREHNTNNFSPDNPTAVAVSNGSSVDKRIDPQDGHLYTKYEFFQRYRRLDEWNAAEKETATRQQLSTNQPKIKDLDPQVVRLKRVVAWSGKEVKKWLESVREKFGITEHSTETFTAYGVNGDILLDLRERDIRDIGIRLSQAKAILSAINSLKQVDNNVVV